MSFWNVNLDDWIRRQLYFDESISAYVFRTTDWYDNNSWHNKYSEFHDIIEWYNADRLEEKDLLEEFQDIIPRHNKQEWPEELVIEEYQTMPEEQINLEPFISYYYYINAGPKVSNQLKFLLMMMALYKRIKNTIV